MDTVLTERVQLSLYAEDVPDVPGFIHTIRNVLSPEECTEVIRIAEANGFSTASLYTDTSGIEHFSDIRKSARCIIDSEPFATALWSRIRHVIPETWNEGRMNSVGINKRLRLLRYYPGDEFKPHCDGSYISPESHISKITILIYLNVGYEGGYTMFMGEKGWVEIVPQVGSIAIQDQALLHCVPPLKNGVKYALRTEVMYAAPQCADSDIREFTVQL
jgi:hypothetical protein